MASIKFGAIVTDARGKLGGHVFQKGNQSRVLKTGGKPVKRINTNTRLTQNFVNAGVQAYSALSFTAKQNWNAIAPNFNRVNRFGDTIPYNGRQLYLYLYNNLQKAGYGTTPDITALDPNVSLWYYTSVSINTTTDEAIRVSTAKPTDYRVQTFFYRAKKGQTRIDPNKLVYWEGVNVLTATSSSYTTALEARFGVLTPGQNVYVGTRAVNPTGFAGQIQFVKITLT